MKVYSEQRNIVWDLKTKSMRKKPVFCGSCKNKSKRISSFVIIFNNVYLSDTIQGVTSGIESLYMKSPLQKQKDSYHRKCSHNLQSMFYYRVCTRVEKCYLMLLFPAREHYHDMSSENSNHFEICLFFYV